MAAAQDIAHLGFDTHHFRHTGAVDIGIENTDHHLFFANGGRQIHRHAGFTHAALAAEDGDLVVDLGHGILDRAVVVAMRALLRSLIHFNPPH